VNRFTPMIRQVLPLIVGILCSALGIASCAMAAERAECPRVKAHRPSPIALGVFVGESDLAPRIDAFHRLTCSYPAIVMWYQGFDQRLYRWSQIRAVAARGETPEVTWDPVKNGSGIPLRALANGQYDNYLKASARLASAWKKPIMIRFAPEMNLRSSLWGPSINGNTPHAFVKAWEHVVHVFRAHGATNVRWIWSPDQDCNGRCPFTAYYPGDRWVDWVGLDGYNGGPALNEPWLSLARVLGDSYRVLARISAKPLMIAETACAPRGGDKAAWIRQAFLHTIPYTMPRVRAVTWFNVKKETDWRVNSSQAALRAFRESIRSKFYNGGGK
jgi:hypothetical protein